VIRIGVTGTDTGVGKTVVTCGLVAALRRRGLRVVGMKPVESGVAPDDPTRDGARIARAAGETRPLSVTAPITFPDAVAPLVAARRAGRVIDLDRLDASVKEASRDADVLVVEGAGGLLVPVTDRLSFDMLFARWALEPIVVAANRLGVINHVRLTLAACRAAGLRPRAVVLNTLSTLSFDSSTAENAKMIGELERIAVCELPWLPRLDDLEHNLGVVEQSGLVELLVPALRNPV
jgi:dethiobiotin synthetase